MGGDTQNVSTKSGDSRNVPFFGFSQHIVCVRLVESLYTVWTANAVLQRVGLQEILAGKQLI